MSIFSIGLSGLNTAQIALSTTSNNISNVYTPGYNRELTLVSEQQVGGGAQVTDVQRQFDHFISSQLNTASSSLSALKTAESQISQIDQLLGDLDAGLAPIMGSFFSSLQDLAAAPSDPAARQGVIGTAESLSAQFRSLDRYLHDMQEGISSRLDSEVIQINNTVEQIAKLNHELSMAKAKTGEAPNTLLNQRDHLVAELSKQIDTELHIQNGSYSITVGNGQPLVAGSQAYSLATTPSAADPSRKVVAYVDSAGNKLELDHQRLSGGSLGGLLEFRSGTLDTVQNKVGQLALSLAMGFNEQHQAGIDLEGDAGEAFFSTGEPTVFTHGKNTGTASLSGVFADHAGLTGADYNLRFDAVSNEFQVTRVNGGASFQVPMDPVTGDIELDGMLLTVSDPALLVNGDRFQVQPTRRAAGDIETLVQDTARIAAGETGASGDNRNAQALQDLQSAKLVGGDASLSQAYASIIGDVGNRTNVIQVNMAAQESLTEQIRMVQQSESGVNLDEEAANLIRYQQYYQANARVIETGTTLFDTILGLRA